MWGRGIKRDSAGNWGSPTPEPKGTRGYRRNRKSKGDRILKSRSLRKVMNFGQWTRPGQGDLSEREAREEIA